MNSNPNPTSNGPNPSDKEISPATHYLSAATIQFHVYPNPLVRPRVGEGLVFGFQLVNICSFVDSSSLVKSCSKSGVIRFITQPVTGKLNSAND